MQSVFSVAAQRRDAGVDCRAATLKTDWTKPPQGAAPMGIEWFAEP
jgi:hypothetical protein